MTKLKIQLLTAFLFVATASFAGKPTKISWHFDSFFDNQIYPSYSWAVSQLGNEASGNSAGNFYGDANGQMGAMFDELKAKTKVRIVVESPEIMETSELSFEMAVTRQDFYAYPQIIYKWQNLSTWRQPRPVSILITVYVNDKLVSSQNKIMQVRSINDCPYIAITNKSVMLDLNYVYTSYVNENHPIITDSIIPGIIKEGIIKKITGYQGSTDDVYLQVYAVWDYFNKHNFSYSSLNSYFKGDIQKFPHVSAQYVRTFEEIFHTRQANCVEGTVLMASILMRMGIKPFLITTPSHCYLGFDIDGTGQSTSFVETTLLGEDLSSTDTASQSVCRNYNLTEYDTYLRLTSFGKNTYDNFIWALLVGSGNWTKDADKYDEANEGAVEIVTLENVNETFAKFNYQKISVVKYRELGLLPINH
ncbi:MAG: hypothetical protein H7321_06050 [Bacteroidia bacterium]|nr:hypothetical protein [Bacteroidia bacterium]